jgi:hypothetical protein
MQNKMENIKILQAILLLAETLNYSNSYKQTLIDEIQDMLKHEKK